MVAEDDLCGETLPSGPRCGELTLKPPKLVNSCCCGLYTADEYGELTPPPPPPLTMRLLLGLLSPCRNILAGGITEVKSAEA